MGIEGSPAGDEEPEVIDLLSTTLPQPTYLMAQHGNVMSEEQLDALRKQICVYATICQQLVEMHKASKANVMLAPQSSPPDSSGALQKLSSKPRWTPSESQLKILDKLFKQCNGTPSRMKIKEITLELSQHGQLSETNVYNWFQNRKARARRKQQHLGHSTHSEVDTDRDSSEERKRKVDINVRVEKPKKEARTTLGHNEHHGNPTTLGHNEHHGNPGNRNPGCSSIILNGKSWKVRSGVINTRTSFGEGVGLLDSKGHIVPSDESGLTLQPLLAGESYTVVGLQEIMGGGLTSANLSMN